VGSDSIDNANLRARALPNRNRAPARRLNQRRNLGLFFLKMKLASDRESVYVDT
jgi:hypothetical protein